MLIGISRLFNQRLPILPGRFHPSTFGVCGLNCCVRHGNRWFPAAIATECSELLYPENYSEKYLEPLRSLKLASYLFTGQFCAHLTPSHNSGVSDSHIFVRLFVPSKLVRCLSQVLGLLVPVRSMCCHTSTPGLSTMSSSWDLTCLRNEKPHL